MKRQIIKIDEEKCNGCGLCVSACHEGAIGLVDGKAQLLRDDFCDGLGNCLPVCPTGAIEFEEREAKAFDEAAVKKAAEKLPCGCPGTQVKNIAHKAENCCDNKKEDEKNEASELRQWPVQIKLVPANAPYFQNANLLIAADCTAYAINNFHNRFMKGKITLIGCPKLDNADYSEKLAAILETNEIKSVTVLRMEVPCCGGIVSAVTEALRKSGKITPWQVITISTDGEVIEN